MDNILTLLLPQTPFRLNRKQSRDEVKKNTLVAKIDFPDLFSSHAVSLISK
eukprot:Pgem_evm1s6463